MRRPLTSNFSPLPVAESPGVACSSQVLHNVGNKNIFELLLNLSRPETQSGQLMLQSPAHGFEIDKILTNFLHCCQLIVSLGHCLGCWEGPEYFHLFWEGKQPTYYFFFFFF